MLKKNAVGSKDLNECVLPYCEVAYSVWSPTERETTALLNQNTTLPSAGRTAYSIPLFELKKLPCFNPDAKKKKIKRKVCFV